jgi:2,4-dienoyl-CoA reductase (NADPH2)
VTGVELHLGARVTADDVADFDEVVIATGVVPRVPAIPGVERALSYVDVVRHGAPVGDRVAVIGAGGIGVDVSEFLTSSPGLDVDEWRAEWGVTDPELVRGGVTEPKPTPAARQVYLLQRKTSRIGKGLGKTTGWVHRAALAAKGVEQLTGVNYERIDDAGVHITFGEKRERPRVLEVDTVVVCAGQESVRDLADVLTGRGVVTHVIGGADVAAELDAKRAIDQGTRLAATI